MFTAVHWLFPPVNGPVAWGLKTANGKSVDAQLTSLLDKQSYIKLTQSSKTTHMSNSNAEDRDGVVPEKPKALLNTAIDVYMTTTATRDQRVS